MPWFVRVSSQESKAYSTPELSLLRTFMMMLELDYMASFNAQFVDGEKDTLHFGNITLILLVVFVLFMPILLINLLVRQEGWEIVLSQVLMVFFFRTRRASTCNYVVLLVATVHFIDFVAQKSANCD